MGAIAGMARSYAASVPQGPWRPNPAASYRPFSRAADAHPARRPTGLGPAPLRSDLEE
ncbi:hypothetical protein PKB_2682 [Pseudomonas knackmussii B13]|uniref:Uncharacterized protein n=1 Tax=Pseudomonas knackmussii (strain DSM 6978 / CCUG 54928 / LMG 23759 / B13) TaxID=1301098 RepID=A0A024HHC7_PSEKB|nr:hypothetical protein PKB_2682 [Pseudomonas knackmussii B13]